MDIHIFEAGKPANARTVDRQFTIASGKISIGGGPPCEVVCPGLPPAPQAEIQVDGGKAEIRNLAGGNVAVAGRAVAAGTAMALGPETLLAVGDKELVYRSHASAGTPEAAAEAKKRGPDRPSVIAKVMLKEVFDVLGVPEKSPALVVYDADNNVVKRLDLAPPKEEATIGRQQDNDIVLYHPMVSKQHARVFRDGLGFAVKDLGSRNGLEVNGAVVKDMHRLKSGDKVKIGGFTVRFVDPKAAVDDLAASVPDLSAIDRAAPGEKVVVGAGKSETLGETVGGAAPGKPDTVKGIPSPAAPAAPASAPSGPGPRPAAAPAAAPEEEEAKTSPIVYVLIVVALAVVVGMGVLVWKAIQAPPDQGQSTPNASPR
jgi:hypothetical protein